MRLDIRFLHRKSHPDYERLNKSSLFGNFSLVTVLGTPYILCMRVIAKKRLREFWIAHAAARTPLQSWWSIASHADWKTPQDIKDTFGNSVDFVADNRVIFDIGGNNYRLIVHFKYEKQVAFIKFIGTHAEYDKIDAETV